MSDLKYLTEGAKLCHDIKDTADIAEIDYYMCELNRLACQGEWDAVNQLIGVISERYRSEANDYNKNRKPAQTSPDAARACYWFLQELRNKKTAKKSAEKLAEEAHKHSGGNDHVH